MKVLFLTHYSGLYGANKSLLQLIHDLKKNHNVEAHVLLVENGILIDHLEKSGISYTRLKYYHWLNNNSFIKSRVKMLLNLILLPYAVFKLRSLLKSIDLIHTNTSVINLGGHLSRIFKIPHIWHIREYGLEDYNLRYPIGLKSAGEFYNKHAHTVIAISKDIANYYSKYINPDKVKTIYNGIKKTGRIEKEYNKSSDLNICIVGLITAEKNQIEVIRAIHHLIDEMNILNFKLHIIGDGDTFYVKQLVDYSKKLKIEPFIEMHGYLPQIDHILKNMDLGIVPSFKEAFGRTTVEFMMNKIPVIASSSGANPEIISSSDLGELYELGNHKALANKIADFINNREKIEKIAENAYQHAVNNFSSDLNAENVFNTYTKALQKI